MSKVRKIIIRIIRVLTVAFFLTVIACSARELIEYNKGKNDARALSERVVSRSVAAEPEKKSGAVISVDFGTLQAENSDVIGWLYCEDTPINYPVVQSDDNDYYLRRGFDKKHLYSGTLFADYRCSGDFSGKNTVIYGHNMKNAEMFGTLVNYENQEYFDAHPEMFLITPSADCRIRLICGIKAQSTSEIYDGLLDQATAEATVRAAIEKSEFKADYVLTGEERFITLSTCSYDSADARFIIIGVLEKM